MKTVTNNSQSRLRYKEYLLKYLEQLLGQDNILIKRVLYFIKRQLENKGHITKKQLDIVSTFLVQEKYIRRKYITKEQLTRNFRCLTVPERNYEYTGSTLF